MKNNTKTRALEEKMVDNGIGKGKETFMKKANKEEHKNKGGMKHSKNCCGDHSGHSHLGCCSEGKM